MQKVKGSGGGNETQPKATPKSAPAEKSDAAKKRAKGKLVEDSGKKKTGKEKIGAPAVKIKTLVTQEDDVGQFADIVDSCLINTEESFRG